MIKLACFDLDCTILNGRLNHSLHAAGVAPGTADREALEFHFQNAGGIKNKMALRQTMKELLKNGVQVAITSFGSNPESIPFVLEKIGLAPEEIAQVKTFMWFPDKETRKAQGKNNHIEKAIMTCGLDLKPEEVVLVDDNLNNYELAKQKGYNVIWVQDEKGVGYLNELREMAGLSKAREFTPQAAVSEQEPQEKSWVDKLLGLIGLQRIPEIAR